MGLGMSKLRDNPYASPREGERVAGGLSLNEQRRWQRVQRGLLLVFVGLAGGGLVGGGGVLLLDISRGSQGALVRYGDVVVYDAWLELLGQRISVGSLLAWGMLLVMLLFTALIAVGMWLSVYVPVE